MAKVIGDIVYPTGKYVKNGEEKTSWTNIGILMETDKGLRIKLNALPIGGENGSIWLSVFEKNEEQSPQRHDPDKEPF